MSLFAELKRRRVFRVVGVYAIAAWAAIQVGDTILPRLGLPDWSVTFVIVIALLGFPVAVGLAWAFDLTPEGVQRTSNDPTARPLPRNRAFGYIGAGMLLALVLYGMYDFVRPAPQSATEATPVSASPSVAVLPFVNMSDSKENEYFSDGITEDVLNALAQIEGLRVAGRTSSFAFKGKDLPVADIARQLGVAAVLAGSVQRVGDRVRITAQLSNGADGMNMWSQKFDRDAKDIFAVEDEISRAIADALRIKLSARTENAIAGRQTHSPEAHDLYLIGLHNFHRRGAQSLHAAVRYFEQAIAVDSAFALAWAGLALAQAVLPVYDFDVPAADAFLKTKLAAERALQLDSTLAEAHTALGQAIGALDWDYPRARREFERAIALNPNFATAHHWLGESFFNTAEFAASRAHLIRAQQLDPLSPVIRTSMGYLDCYEGKYNNALNATRAAEKLDPSFSLAPANLGWIYSVMGNYEAAGTAYHRWARLEGYAHGNELLDLFHRLTRKQPPGELTRVFEDPALRRGLGYVGIAGFYVLVGDHQRALDMLEAGVQHKDNVTPTIGVDPIFKPLRPHPRFKAVLRSVNLDPATLPK